MQNRYKLDEAITRFYGMSLEKKEKEINKQGIVSVAVDLAYRDAQRTMTGVGSVECNGAKKLAVNNLKERIERYREEGMKGAFDDYHKEFCDIWKGAFAENSALARQGKAQKIVNMSFKYLFCYDYMNNNDQFLDAYEFCHYTLDAYTLRWLRCCKRLMEPAIKLENDKDFMMLFNALRAAVSWSKLDDTEYKLIQTYAQMCVDRHFKGLSCFLAEFLIWDGVKYYDALKAIQGIEGHYWNDADISKLVSKVNSRYDSALKDEVTFIDYIANCEEKEQEEIIEVDITKVKPNPDVPMRQYSEEGLDELAESIKKHGLITPLEVYEDNGQYIVIAGIRRLRAAQYAGVTTIPVIIREKQ